DPMTLARQTALQAAIYNRLAAELSTAAPSGAAVPVFDHVPQSPPRLHVRIDGFTVVAVPVKFGATQHARHSVDVHVFDRPLDAGGRGQFEAKRVLGLAHTALDGWPPFSGNALTFDDSFVDLDADGATFHARATYSIILGDT
ncbi:MAG: hypothetical protein AAFR16_00715, partial [Pseudomonadota bacterium]